MPLADQANLHSCLSSELAVQRQAKAGHAWDRNGGARAPLSRIPHLYMPAPGQEPETQREQSSNVFTFLCLQVLSL